MGSRDGFARADTDTGLYHDPKVLKLARRLRDPVKTACALVLWDACRLASWKADDRLQLPDTVPAWWTDDPAELLSALKAVGLLDGRGRIPARSFVAWTARARGQSEAAATAARARWDKVQEEAESGTPMRTHMRTHSGRNADAMPRQTDRQTDRQTPSRGPARAGGRAPARTPAREEDHRSMAEIFNDLGVEPPQAAKVREK